MISRLLGVMALTILTIAIGCGGSGIEDPAGEGPVFRDADPRVDIDESLKGIIRVADVTSRPTAAGLLEVHLTLGNFSERPRYILVKTYFKTAAGEFLDESPEAIPVILVSGKPRDYTREAYDSDASDFLVRIIEGSP